MFFTFNCNTTISTAIFVSHFFFANKLAAIGMSPWPGEAHGGHRGSTGSPGEPRLRCPGGAAAGGPGDLGSAGRPEKKNRGFETEMA